MSLLPQYNAYYTDDPDGTAHAGTAILVKQTRASLPFKMSTKEATSTDPNYNLIQTHSYNLYQGTISHGG
jgi:hypothetical protein